MNGLRHEPKLVDEKLDFTVEPHYVELPKPPVLGEVGIEKEKEELLPSAEFTEEELMFLSESIWGIPGIIYSRLDPPNPEKLKRWNHQFYLYCVKKNINPWEYFFDEFGILMATISLGSETWRDYGEKYGKKEKKEELKPT